MKLLLFIGVLLLASLMLNAYFKIKSYAKQDKSVWQDGDSVRIKESDASNEGFMTRIS